jgi:hypothetical protein
MAFVSSGCSGRTYVTLDGDVVDAARPPDGSLVLSSSPSLAIRPGEVGVIEVQLLDVSGAAVAGAEVTFAIEGAALDSTLSALSMRTDATGHAAGGIVAGTQATSFRVRVVSRDAPLPVYVDVGVGTSFGTLIVRAPYAGDRIVTHRIVDVVPRARCADLAGSPPEVGARALPDGSDELSIAGLPTTVHYAVLARAQSDVALTASGCVDDVELSVDATTRVDVPFVDVALGIEGRYTARLSLDASAATDVAFEAMQRTLAATADARGGDAHLMLDAVETELTRRHAIAGAAFAEARVRDSLDASFTDQLALDASGPTVLIAHWIGAARAAMASPRIEATLIVAMPGATATTDHVTVDDAADGTLSLAPASFDPSLGVPHTFVVRTVGSSDSIRVEGVALDAPLGATLLAWLDAVAESDGLPGRAGLLAPACGTLRTFALSLPAASECDDACLDAACATAIATQLEELGSAAALVDATTGVLTLSGALDASDADGDVRVDALAGALSGAYEDGSGSTLGPVTGAVEVTRAPVP